MSKRALHAHENDYPTKARRLFVSIIRGWPRNANDHEREGARTSGVTRSSWSSATEPCGYNVAIV